MWFCIRSRPLGGHTVMMTRVTSHWSILMQSRPSGQNHRFPPDTSNCFSLFAVTFLFSLSPSLWQGVDLCILPFWSAIYEDPIPPSRTRDIASLSPRSVHEVLLSPRQFDPSSFSLSPTQFHSKVGSQAVVSKLWHPSIKPPLLFFPLAYYSSNATHPHHCCRPLI